MHGKARGSKLHVHMLCKLGAFSGIFYLAMNTNGTLGGFSYHLFSVIYASLFFVVTFERLAKIFQTLKMIHSGYSRSCFNLLLFTALYKPLQT